MNPVNSSKQLNKLLSPEDLEKHAVELANSHLVGECSKFPKWLIARMDSNYKEILNVYQAINRDINGEIALSPTTEWLLDNFYIIEEQVKDIKFNISKRHYFRLPMLKNNGMKGYPRIYNLALELVADTDGSIDEKSLINFVRAYQTGQPLAMGELWAVAVMLRIGLVEKIGQICKELKFYFKQRHEAERAAALLTEASAQGGREVQRIIRDQIGDRLCTRPPFTELLVQILRKKGKKDALLVGIIDKMLRENGCSLENLINSEHQTQAGRQVSIGNAITSLRTIAAVDWNEIFESLSHVEEILRRDPSGYYNQMDFESRDHYRHIVEKISQFYKVPEIDVAHKALSCAQTASGEDNQNPVRHVGFYLISSGRKKLERRIGVRPRGLKATLNFLQKHPHVVYFSSISLIILAVIGVFLGYSVNHGPISPWILLLTGLVILLPVSDISINIVNFAVSNIYSPSLLPKLQLREGITEENATMVIIPTLLPNEKRVRELIKKVEICYLANKERNLYFALVGDFKDSALKESQDDQKIIDTALEGVNKLNRLYSGDRRIFYYFHRRRSYSEVQRQWMGWERKRGAILEFNDLLRGSDSTSFNVSSCNVTELPDVKFVITLDADTNLPMGAAKRLIGTMAHPLNKPVIDRKKGAVVKGHGILQPRIGVGLDSANKTIFSRVFAGQGGIDPYTTAVSDVYQDLFGEGIFAGKGIYHLDTFQSLLKDAIPENAVLSHDLLEGSYIRTGLVTDIELIDGYPARYNSFSMRLHRWVRGDWQLFPWLGARVKNRQGKRAKNPLSALSKWKIVDNMRRSLLNPALFVLIMMGFTVLPGSSLTWLGLAVVTVGFPTITYLAGGILAKNYHLIEGAKGQTVITGVRAGVYQAILQFIFIADQAYLMLDGIIRTLYRVFVSRKNLLEWIPAADLEALLKSDLASYYKKMIFSPAAGILTVGLTVASLKTAAEVTLAGIVAALWVIAPSVAFRVSQDYTKKVHRIDANELTELRRLARKTWGYFEDLVTDEDHYLPPDNYQIDPPKGKAHRTSPTNIGLSLVAALTARDMGYIGTAELINRTDLTLSTLEKLEKWEGHLYNWYDTTDLRVLRPRYVSTVDSGNFVGYLLVLEEGLKEYLSKPLNDSNFAQGLLDTIRIFNEELEEVEMLIKTNILEHYLHSGDCDTQGWLSVLEVMSAELFAEDRKAKVQASPWGRKLVNMVSSFKREACASHSTLLTEGEGLLKRIRFVIDTTKFTPLFDAKRQLFSIGYNVEEGMLTKSYYDLLASEARLASFIAVARGEVDKKHWFRLGRKLTRVEGYKGLASWSGTMFEYFMPLLVMKNFENSLLDVTYSFVVHAQKKYGQKREIPWGISESAYYAFDADLNYQYKAFGIPELGFKRGLGHELVVAPYATVMTLSVDPKGAIENILRLKREGMDGDYGLYEAIDYTPARAALTGKRSVVKNFMVHHQGMSILALNNYLNQDVMQKRFHANPVIQSAELLLQERMPFKVSVTKEVQEEVRPLQRKTRHEPEVVRKYGVPESELPKVHLLSNGSYAVMVTDGGAGYSKNNDTAIARWRENLRGTSSGFFIYVQNINANNVWSATYEPYNVKPESYRVVFSPDKAEFIRTDGNIETHTQIVVSPEDNAEIRTVTLTNNSRHSRVVEVTSYLEVVLTSHDADLAHPAFSNLFVKTEFIPKYQCLLAVRRPRSVGQQHQFAIHTVAVKGELIGNLQYETDRAKFIGRNRNLNNPLAMDVDQPLSNTVGAVLDPVMSIRCRVRIEPGHSAKVSYALAVTGRRQEALKLADKYRDGKTIERAFELAWNRSRIEADYLDIKAEDTEVYLNMVPSILYPGPARRKYEEFILQNKKGQTCLWPFGISGDIPMVLAAINDKGQVDLVYSLLKAHEFWRMKGLKVDLIFMAEDEGGYVQPLQDSIREAIFASPARDLVGRTGGVYLLNANAMAAEEKVLIYASARIIIKGDGGPIADQLSWNEARSGPAAARIRPAENQDAKIGAGTLQAVSNLDSSQLMFYNGFGGFAGDGNEYVIHLREGQHTPAPWSNVIANDSFGFNITESGAGYTWAENSRENKLTPWYNDPVTDLLGEAVYVRDEQSGHYWSITPMPVREREDYIVRHGKGYSSFEHTSHGIEQRLTEYVALDAPVKMCLIELKNMTAAPKKLSATYYMRPIMGVNEKVNGQYITTDRHGEKEVLLITNSYNCDFPGRIAFIDSSEVKRSVTGDGNEFIGVNGSMERPLAMVRESLSGTVGAGLVPCAAMQVEISLKPQESREVVFVLGQGKHLSEVEALAGQYSNPAEARSELDRVREFWKEKLGVVQVKTPDKAMDILLNSWLLYQVVSCRVWSRAAFYQSGGAYGFRDQLQDVMSLAPTWPELTRKQILLHSAHQFVEGDAQHWWHPGVNKGIRTRYSDDFLWLPYVTADYIETTADWSILDEVVSFLEDDPLPEHEDEKYNIPRISAERNTVYIHCIRAIENAFKFGVHGLPLMGSGDWNDGMNTVGNKGKGESVWLAWFLYTVLQKFIPICNACNDVSRAGKYSEIAEKIAEAIENNAWDGSWYRRAYFDSGIPLGSAENSECKIDSIAQSWSVISGVGKPHRAEEAMRAVEKYLVDREAGVIKLLAPPFGDGDLEPGYIKSYIPGVRENGGQYTHAAVWTILAFAKLGYGDTVGELFQLINPINHSRSSIEAMRYKVEPYVAAADVYAVDPNRGRGGWSWYTGAAGWMYRVGIEDILGVKKVGKSLYFDPCVPRDWSEFDIEYRLPETLYKIHVQNPDRVNKGVKKVSLNGKVFAEGHIPLIDDGGEHLVEIIMGQADHRPVTPRKKTEDKAAAVK